MSKRAWLGALTGCLLWLGAGAQVATGLWDAQWVAHPEASAYDYGVHHFRRTLDVAGTVPTELLAHVSADNRYKLYVNGAQVGEGPARGDQLHWRYETVDLAPHLRSGRNVVAAVVWNFGELRPAAQMTHRTGFILQAEGELADSLNTGSGWEVLIDSAYAPERTAELLPRTYIVVGPGDIVDARHYPWGWETARDTATNWTAAAPLGAGTGAGRGTNLDWALVPREIPAMRRDSVALGRLVDTLTNRRRELPTAGLSVPANAHRRFLIAADALEAGYPVITVDGGADARIEVTYAEALVDAEGAKGQRDDVRGKHIVGYRDVWLPDGGPGRRFEPLWYRTYRYLQLDVTTAAEGLHISEAHLLRTGYPFTPVATLTTQRGDVDSILAVGWRTAERCAHETYLDCPYYEQLQYVGDTRIQALISLYNTGDDRLMRRALLDFDQSRISDGLTQSRYPSSRAQFIPPYSLFWVAMVHDYWMHRPDTAFVRGLLPGVEAVLGWHAVQLNARGMLGRTPYWSFVDWVPQWPWDNASRVGGVPPQLAEGSSAVLALQYAYVLGYAQELMGGFGDSTLAERYGAQRDALNAAARRACYDEVAELFADVPGGRTYSQHANAMAVLAGAVTGEEARRLMRRVLDDPSLTQATVYYKFYVFEAMRIAGNLREYLDGLDLWRAMLAQGLTTFAEQPEPTRSDCHAWSASPSYQLYSLVAGIRPAAPGWREVLLNPTLGPLDSLRASVPHPSGTITVSYVRRGDSGLRAEVTLPAGVSGELLWSRQRRALRPGTQVVEID